MEDSSDYDEDEEDQVIYESTSGSETDEDEEVDVLYSVQDDDATAHAEAALRHQQQHKGDGEQALDSSHVTDYGYDLLAQTYHR